MDLTERRDFPLADALSVTTGTLLSRSRMAGLCALVEWLEREPAFPARMYKPDMVRLLLASRAAAEHLTAQHPFLSAIKPPAGLDSADLYSWLLDTERAHGESLTLSRAPLPGTVAAMDQVTAGIRDGFAEMRENVHSWVNSVEAAKRALDDFALSLRRGRTLSSARRRHELRARVRLRWG